MLINLFDNSHDHQSCCSNVYLEKTVTIDFGNVWCVPVYDGTNIVVSSESGGVIKVGKLDLSLNQVTSPATTVADTSDTANNDSIADHKHIFQNGYHYLVFPPPAADKAGICIC